MMVADAISSRALLESVKCQLAVFDVSKIPKTNLRLPISSTMPSNALVKKQLQTPPKELNQVPQVDPFSLCLLAKGRNLSDTLIILILILKFGE
jgi:hypothetical protein